MPPDTQTADTASEATPVTPTDVAGVTPAAPAPEVAPTPEPTPVETEPAQVDIPVEESDEAEIVAPLIRPEDGVSQDGGTVAPIPFRTQ